MQNRKLNLCIALGFITISMGHHSTFAAPIQLDDSTTLEFDANTQLVYYSNLFLTDPAITNKENETIWVLTPTASIEKGDDTSQLRFQGSLGFYHYEFLDNSEFSRTDPFITLSGTINGDRLQATGTAIQQDIILPSHGNRNAEGYSNTRLNTVSSYDLSARSSIASDATFRKLDYDQNTRVDRSYYTLPIRFLYNISEDLKFGLGYRFRKNKFDGSVSNRNDTIWHLSLEGKLTQDIDLDFRIGHNQSDFRDPTFKDLETIYVSGDATWQITEDSRLTANLSNRAGAFSNGQSVERLSFRTNYQWAITEKLNSSAGISFLNEDFQNSDRQDKLKRIEAALIYQPETQPYSGRLSLSYEDNDSNIFGLDYTNTILSTSFNYSF
ncbi:outer membrane beta-barrel protein [Puniceicoccaceae bacterium K14]|nr:outer membrane beta-barrel protein [Puniceicoccaceae bacterium K14]